MSPSAQLPVAVLPLWVAVSAQLAKVAAAHALAAQVSATCVQVPSLQEKEQAPVNPLAQAPVAVAPLGVEVSRQLAVVLAGQGSRVAPAPPPQPASSARPTPPSDSKALRT